MVEEPLIHPDLHVQRVAHFGSMVVLEHKIAAQRHSGTNLKFFSPVHGQQCWAEWDIQDLGFAEGTDVKDAVSRAR